jgi:hypothetical protein
MAEQVGQFRVDDARRILTHVNGFRNPLTPQGEERPNTRSADEPVWAKVTGRKSGAEKYSGVILDWPENPISESSDLTGDDLGAEGGECMILNAAGLGSAGHSLPNSAIIKGRVVQVMADGTPVVSGAVMEPLSFVALITGASRDGSNWRWAYSVAEAHLTGDGWTWAALDGGRTGTAYNRVEMINGATGMTGLGMSYPDDFNGLTPAPIPNGVPVRVEVYSDTAGAVRWWFSETNGLAGSCS